MTRRMETRNCQVAAVGHCRRVETEREGGVCVFRLVLSVPFELSPHDAPLVYS